MSTKALIRVLAICVLAMATVMPVALAQTNDVWQLRDRDTKIRLVMGGFLDEEADFSNVRSVAAALLRLREVYKLPADTPDAISSDDLRTIRESKTENPFQPRILLKPLTKDDVAILRRIEALFNDRFMLETAETWHKVKFYKPKSLGTSSAAKGFIVDYHNTGSTPAERNANEARVIIDGLHVMSVPSNRQSVIDLFEGRVNKDKTKTSYHESLRISPDRVVAKYVRTGRLQERFASRMYVAGSRIISINTASLVDPVANFVPLEPHRLLAEAAIERREVAQWLTPTQCAALAGACGGDIATGSLPADPTAEEQRAKIVRSVAWRLMTNSITQYMFSEFDRQNDWKFFDASNCHFDGPKEGTEQVRVIAGSDRRFDEPSWPSGEINTVFGEKGDGSLGLYCLLVQVPQKPAVAAGEDKIVDEKEIVVTRTKLPKIGVVPRGFDQFSIIETPRHRPGTRALVYVHGFNNKMSDAIDRVARIARELRGSYWGRFYLYSWPSADSLLHYMDDLDRSEQAETHLRNFVRMIARDPNVERIDFVAHSMGSALLLRALSGLSLEVDTTNSKRIGQVILAAPDIQNNVFEARMALVAPFASRVTIYASDKDRALQWRKVRYGGDYRVGALTAVSAPFDTIHFVDVGNVLPGAFQAPFDQRHDYFVTKPRVLRDLVGVLKAGLSGSLDGQEAEILRNRSKGATGPTQDVAPEPRPKIWKLTAE